MNQYQRRLDLAAVIALVLLAVVTRFMTHSANYSPVLAMTFFAGASFTNKRFAVIFPLLAILASDLVIGFYDVGGFYDGISFVYLGYLFAIAVGTQINNRKPVTLAVGAVGVSAAFFIYSNLGVWFFTPIYPQTLEGLKECYIMALPFFDRTLISTVVSTGVLFALHTAFQRFALGVTAPSRAS